MHEFRIISKAKWPVTKFLKSFFKNYLITPNQLKCCEPIATKFYKALFSFSISIF